MISIGITFIGKYLQASGQRKTRENKEQVVLTQRRSSHQGHIEGRKKFMEYRHICCSAMIIQGNRILVFKETEVQTKGGAWYLMRVIPYRTSNNVIDGSVITFSDITDFKETQKQMAERTEYSEGIVRTVREPFVVLNGDLRVVSANPSFYRTFQVTPLELEGQLLYDLGNRQWDIPALRKLLEEILPKNAQVEDFLVENDFPVIGHKKMLLNAKRIEQENDRSQLILLAIEDITNRKE
ncbi:PAS fold protein [uncultured archaeon]|nr:PAS fold protein [uncultured archaeon]